MVLADLLAAVRLALSVERLPPPPPASAGPTRAPRTWRLLAPEPLPRDPLQPRRARRSWLRLLFAPEPLPRDPPTPPRRPGRWLRWLLRPERLDVP